jgi:hypothetical protein
MFATLGSTVAEEGTGGLLSASPPDWSQADSIHASRLSSAELSIDTEDVADSFCMRGTILAEMAQRGGGSSPQILHI